MTSCCRLFFLDFAFDFSRAHYPVLKLTFKYKCLKVEGKEAVISSYWAVCIFSVYWHWGGVQNNKPSTVLVHMELAVTLGKLETIKLLCLWLLLWHIILGGQGSEEPTNRKEWRTWTEPIGVRWKNSKRKGSQRKEEALFNQYLGSHWKHTTMRMSLIKVFCWNGDS